MSNENKQDYIVHRFSVLLQPAVQKYSNYTTSKYNVQQKRMDQR